MKDTHHACWTAELRCQLIIGRRLSRPQGFHGVLEGFRGFTDRRQTEGRSRAGQRMRQAFEGLGIVVIPAGFLKSAPRGGNVIEALRKLIAKSLTQLGKPLLQFLSRHGIPPFGRSNPRPAAAHPITPIATIIASSGPDTVRISRSLRYSP